MMMMIWETVILGGSHHHSHWRDHWSVDYPSVV
jgi:hypothetical protein